MGIGYIALGSNKGDKFKQIKNAVDLISNSNHLRLLRVSSLFETEPKEMATQKWFLNAVVEIKTRLGVENLFKELLLIEKKLGRKKTEKNKKLDRVIDLDLLFYDQLILEKDNLIVPHPKIAQRKFVLAPLFDLVPDFIHPVFQKTVKVLLDELNDDCLVRIVNQKL